ncbi:major facilitator superfamily domain-containing protein [Aspergillus karnatakaensis]|uniref:major facilitator superfamily domain-containing protein n=1 Tax=Aspergillus karnatakaensis TaxID=1810916 RepID=UPI003CCD18CE
MAKEEIHVHSENIDSAAEYVGDSQQYTPEQERQCLRRVDLVLMPVMFVTMALQYMDKACLTGAAMFGILTDLDLVQLTRGGLDMTRYSHATMIFYWGYLLGTPPAVILAQKAPLAKYVSIMMTIWGGVTVCTVAVHSWQGLLVQRFFLGFAEASVSPAFSLVTAMWYRRHEHPLRIAIWYSSTGLGTLVGAMLLYAIGDIDGALPAWRYQFMIIGCATSIWGIALWFLLPDNPMTARFLSPELRKVAIMRIAGEQIGIENKKVKKEQVREALLDIKTWAYVTITFFGMLVNGALTGFGTVITQSFGYSEVKTILLIGAVGAVSFISLLSSGIISVFIKNMRIYLATFACFPVLAGAAMVWRANWAQKIVPLWGMYLMGFFPVVYVMTLSLATANTAGHTKKAVTAGMMWASYCISNGIAPLLVFGTEKEEQYPTTFKIVIASSVIAAAVLIALRVYLTRVNARRDRENPVDEDEVLATALLDRTDKENLNFRYQM